MKLFRGHYKADACIIWCFDNRFWPAFLEFIKAKEIDYFDPIFVAGGAKNLGEPATEADKLFTLKQIELSVKLHHTSKVILMTHEDCGAFGGSGAFEGDYVREFEHHKTILNAAKKAISEKFSTLLVDAYFCDFQIFKSV